MTSRNRGFSLIELMIAVSLGIVAIMAVGSVFIYGSRNYRQDDKLARTQDELRFAMAQLTQDLEMTGFLAQIRDPAADIEVDASATNGLGAADNCGPGTNWLYGQWAAFVATRGNPSATDANTTFPCIATATLYTGPAGDGTDIIAIKRLGDPVTTTTSGQVYLRTNGVQTTIYKAGGTPPSPTGANVTVYAYKPTVWYIRNFSVSASESPLIPALCRKVLSGGSMQDDEGGCVAQGVEDMQLEFGVDSTGDGAVDYFTEYGLPATTDLPRIVAVRVHLLARALQRDADYKTSKTYTLGSTSYTRDDGFYRKSLSTVVVLRNPATRINPFALPQ